MHNSTHNLPAETEIDEPPSPERQKVTQSQRRVLDAIAWFAFLRIDEPSKIQVAFMAGYKAGSGTVNNTFGSLRSASLVTYPAGGRIALTDQGRQIAKRPSRRATNDELHRAVYARLSGPHQKILQELVAAYPDPIGRDELAGRTGYTAGTGTFNNYLGKLRTLGLIDYPRSGQVRAEDVMFVE